MSVRSDNRPIQYNGAFSNHNSLSNYTIFAYFDIVPNFHGLNDSVLVYKYIIAYLYWYELHLIILFLDRGLHYYILTQCHIPADIDLAEVGAQNKSIHQDHMIEDLNVIWVFNEAVLAYQILRTGFVIFLIVISYFFFEELIQLTHINAIIKYYLRSNKWVLARSIWLWNGWVPTLNNFWSRESDQMPKGRSLRPMIVQSPNSIIVCGYKCLLPIPSSDWWGILC